MFRKSGDPLHHFVDNPTFIAIVAHETLKAVLRGLRTVLELCALTGLFYVAPFAGAWIETFNRTNTGFVGSNQRFSCPDSSFEAKAQAFLEKSPLDLHFVSTFDIIVVVMFFVKKQGKEEPGIPDSFEGFIWFAF